LQSQDHQAVEKPKAVLCASSEAVFGRIHRTKKPVPSRIGRASVVSLSQGYDEQTPKVLSISEGFKVIQSDFGPDFHCDTCNIPALA
jgi:hypothetical protein